MNDDFCRAPVSHVKTHTSMADVREGVVSQFDRAGIAGAGELAKAGAAFHRATDVQERFVRGAMCLHKLLLCYIAQFE
eukprot:5497159-Pyramimonas_sp.AAC.1